MRPLRARMGGRIAPSPPALAVTLILALAAGCGRTDIVVNAAPEAPVEIELAFGEERIVPGTDVRVRFAAVEEDSRCPVGVTCVWEGNAAVRIGLGAVEAPAHEITLNTTLEPKAATWNQMRVTLVDVRPVPREGQPLEDDAYVALLRVEAAEG